MLTEKDYCDYDTCVALRELGYDAPQRLLIDYFGVYDEPQYDERIHLWDAHKWLREEKGLHIELDRVRYEWQVSVVETTKNLCLAVKNRCQSYEEALLEGVRASIKLLKEEK